MPLIEGLGDEVTLILGGFSLCVILLVAWFSTHTGDIPLLREMNVVVVELSEAGGPLVVRELRAGGRRAGFNGEDQAGVVHSSPNETTTSRDTFSGDRTLPPTSSPSSSSSPTLNPVMEEEVLTEGDDEMSSPSASPSKLSGMSSVGVVQNSEEVNNTTEVPEAHSDDNTGTLIPPSSLIVEDAEADTPTTIPECPVGEEMRLRRVQYFQPSQSNSPSPSGCGSSGVDGVTSAEAQHCIRDSDPSKLFSSSRLSGDSTYKKDQQETFREPLCETTQPNVSAGQSLQNASVAMDSGDSAVPVQVETIVTPVGVDNLSTDDTADSRIRVKLKYMNETQRLVYANPGDTIGDFRRANFQPELLENKLVRFIYNGHDLRDDATTLQACNIGDNSTMHCLITAQSGASNTRDLPPDDDEDTFMGAMMYPLFTAVLLVVWYFRFTYRQYFSAMSTVCLIGISFLLGLSYISSLRSSGDQQRHQQQRQQQRAAGSSQQQHHAHSD